MADKNDAPAKGDAQGTAAPAKTETKPTDELAAARAELAREKALREKAENEHLRTLDELDATKAKLASAPKGAHGSPAAGSALAGDRARGRIRVRAMTRMAVMVDGVRRDVEPDERVTVSADDLGGLFPGVHYELV